MRMILIVKLADIVIHADIFIDTGVEASTLVIFDFDTECEVFC